jgi:hypothetical protein
MEDIKKGEQTEAISEDYTRNLLLAAVAIKAVCGVKTPTRVAIFYLPFLCSEAAPILA